VWARLSIRAAELLVIVFAKVRIQIWIRALETIAIGEIARVYVHDSATDLDMSAGLIDEKDRAPTVLAPRFWFRVPGCLSAIFLRPVHGARSSVLLRRMRRQPIRHVTHVLPVAQLSDLALSTAPSSTPSSTHRFCLALRYSPRLSSLNGPRFAIAFCGENTPGGRVEGSTDCFQPQ
jgi:hypothetical protein